MSLRIYYFAVFSAIGVQIPYLPPWLEARGLTGVAMSSLIAVRPAVGILAPIIFGVLADRFAWRGSLVRLASLAAFVTVGVMALLASQGDPPFLPLLVLLGLFALFRTPMTTIADVAALERGNYGSIRLWGSLGFMVAALLVGRFIDPASRAGIPLALAGSLLIALLTSFGLPRTSARPQKPIWGEARRLLGASDFRWLLLATFLWQAAHASYDLCITLRLRDLGASGMFIGWSWALGTFAEVAVMAGSQRLMLRHGARRVVAFAFAVAAARWLLIARIDSPGVLLALQPLHAISFALAYVCSMVHVKERAEPEVLATAQGLYAAAMGCGAAFGLLLWGPLYASSGSTLVFTLAAGIGALSTVALLASRPPLPASHPAPL